MKPTKLSIALIGALTTFGSSAGLSATQEFRTTPITEFGSVTERPFLLTASGVAFRRALLNNNANDFTTIITQTASVTGITGALDVLEAGGLFVDAPFTREELGLVFENYPALPTSTDAEAVLTSLELTVPADSAQFDRLASFVLHAATLNGPIFGDLPPADSLVTETSGEELVGSSAINYYFNVWGNVNSDSDIYRCDIASFDIAQPVISQFSGVCDLVIDGFLNAKNENGMEASNYYDMFGAWERGPEGRIWVILPDGTEANFTATTIFDIDPNGSPFFGKLVLNQGVKPLVMTGLGAIFDLFEATGGLGSDLPTGPSGENPLLTVNEGIYYIHEDGFAEQVVFSSTDSYVRQMNDDYLLVSTFTETDGALEFEREICTYTLTTNYSGGTAGGSGNLGGSIQCDEIVAVKPANHSIALGYDSDVIAGAVYPGSNFLDPEYTVYAVPAYLENIASGERINLAQAERDLRVRQGLGEWYTDAVLLRQTLEGTYAASVEEHGETVAGLLENYPMPPNNPTLFSMTADISQADYLAIIEKAENIAMEINSSIGQIESGDTPFANETFFPLFEESLAGPYAVAHSRALYRFLSPESFMSGEAYYTFENNSTTELTGSVILPGSFIPESGVTVTMLKADGSLLSTTADATGNFAFADLEAGDYTLSIEYPNHVYECVTASVTDQTGAQLVVPLVELLAGDLTGDGQINFADTWRILWRNYFPEVDYDLNNDGSVNYQDAQIVTANQNNGQCQL